MQVALTYLQNLRTVSGKSRKYRNGFCRWHRDKFANIYFFKLHLGVLTQPAFTCSKLTIETLEQGGNMFKVKSSKLTLSIFHTFF